MLKCVDTSTPVGSWLVLHSFNITFWSHGNKGRRGGGRPWKHQVLTWWKFNSLRSCLTSFQGTQSKDMLDLGLALEQGEQSKSRRRSEDVMTQVCTSHVTDYSCSCSCSCWASHNHSRWYKWSESWCCSAAMESLWLGSGTCTGCSCCPQTWLVSFPCQTLSHPPAQTPLSPSGPDTGGLPCSVAQPHRQRNGSGWGVPAPRPRPQSPGSSHGKTSGCGVCAWPPHESEGWRWCYSRCRWLGKASQPCLVLTKDRRKWKRKGRREKWAGAREQGWCQSERTSFLLYPVLSQRKLDANYLISHIYIFLLLAPSCIIHDIMSLGNLNTSLSAEGNIGIFLHLIFFFSTIHWWQ